MYYIIYYEDFISREKFGQSLVVQGRATNLDHRFYQVKMVGGVIAMVVVVVAAVARVSTNFRVGGERKTDKTRSKYILFSFFMNMV